MAIDSDPSFLAMMHGMAYPHQNGLPALPEPGDQFSWQELSRESPLEPMHIPFTIRNGDLDPNPSMAGEFSGLEEFDFFDEPLPPLDYLYELSGDDEYASAPQTPVTLLAVSPSLFGQAPTEFRAQHHLHINDDLLQIAPSLALVRTVDNSFSHNGYCYQPAPLFEEFDDGRAHFLEDNQLAALSPLTELSTLPSTPASPAAASPPAEFNSEPLTKTSNEPPMIFLESRDEPALDTESRVAERLLKRRRHDVLYALPSDDAESSEEGKLGLRVSARRCHAALSTASSDSDGVDGDDEGTDEPPKRARIGRRLGKKLGASVSRKLAAKLSDKVASKVSAKRKSQAKATTLNAESDLLAEYLVSDDDYETDSPAPRTHVPPPRHVRVNMQPKEIMDPVYRKLPSVVEALRDAPEIVVEKSKLCLKGMQTCSKECGVRVSRLEELAAHVDHDHDSEWRAWKCPYGDCVWSILGFHREQECRRHLRTQHNEHCFACRAVGCSRRFPRMDSYRRHYMLTHLNANSRYHAARLSKKALSK